MFSDTALRQFDSWGITAEIAEAAGLFEVDNARQVEPSFLPLAAVVIPYYDVHKQHVRWGPDNRPFCRVRYLVDPADFGFKKAQKYDQAPGSGQHVYFAPIRDWTRLIKDPTEPRIYTEGEGKALCGIANGLPVLALGGVFNFGGDESLLDELEQMAHAGAHSYIAFDSDAATNPDVQLAESRLVTALQLKRRAKCAIVVIPPTDDGRKQGMDDFIKAQGVEAFTKLVLDSAFLTGFDSKVISLNKTCAVIESEGCVYDLETHKFMQRDFFANGSRYSALKHESRGPTQRSGPKTVMIAKAWLTHPHAQRYSEILFRPGAGTMVTDKAGHPALNMWKGWDQEPGDVAQFLELNKFIFKELPAELQDFPLKLMAYKAQHPDHCSRMAIIMCGQQGTGKSKWAKCMQHAFAPYSANLESAHLMDPFTEWLEQSVCVVVDEVEPEHLRAAGDRLKNLITASTERMNTKFRHARQINIYPTFIMSGNKYEIGAFAADDRRFFVVECPKQAEAPPTDFFMQIDAWLDEGAGGRHILHYLLNYDLKGWHPPQKAPDTHAKKLAYTESLTPIQQMADMMKNCTDNNIVQRWVETARAWASNNFSNANFKIAQMAQAALESTSHVQIRPFYEPRELALMFPHLIATYMGAKYDYSMPAGQISRQLRNCGVPALVNRDDNEGFLWQGMKRQYIVVCNFDEWKSPIAQSDFERVMHNAPTYKTVPR